VLDDRLSIFRLNGDGLAAHFAERSLGKSLCESDTWLDCATIDEKFRRILADPFSKDAKKKFFFLPTEAQVPGEGWRRETLNIVWQLRHTIVHNAGVITRSDAAKLRLLVRAPVPAPLVLWPEKSDVQSVKMFLDDLAGVLTQKVADRMGELLTLLLAEDATLLDPARKAQELADQLQRDVTIAGITAKPVEG